MAHRAAARPQRCGNDRLPAAGVALGLDVAFVGGREFLGLPSAMGSGALVVLTGLGVFARARRLPWAHWKGLPGKVGQLGGLM